MPRSGLHALQQPSSGQVEIRKREVYDEPVAGLRESSISNFHEAEDAFDDMEDMLNASTYARFRAVRRAFARAEPLRPRGVPLPRPNAPHFAVHLVVDEVEAPIAAAVEITPAPRLQSETTRRKPEAIVPR